MARFLRAYWGTDNNLGHHLWGGGGAKMNFTGQIFTLDFDDEEQTLFSSHGGFQIYAIQFQSEKISLN